MAVSSAAWKLRIFYPACYVADVASESDRRKCKHQPTLDPLTFRDFLLPSVMQNPVRKVALELDVATAAYIIDLLFNPA